MTPVYRPERFIEPRQVQVSVRAVKRAFEDKPRVHWTPIYVSEFVFVMHV